MFNTNIFVNGIMRYTKILGLSLFMVLIIGMTNFSYSDVITPDMYREIPLDSDLTCLDDEFELAWLTFEEISPFENGQLIKAECVKNPNYIAPSISLPSSTIPLNNEVIPEPIPQIIKTETFDNYPIPSYTNPDFNMEMFYYLPTFLMNLFGITQDEITELTNDSFVKTDERTGLDIDELKKTYSIYYKYSELPNDKDMILSMPLPVNLVTDIIIPTTANNHDSFNISINATSDSIITGIEDYKKLIIDVYTSSNLSVDTQRHYYSIPPNNNNIITIPVNTTSTGTSEIKIVINGGQSITKGEITVN